jgi:hypothetical protein
VSDTQARLDAIRATLGRRFSAPDGTPWSDIEKWEEEAYAAVDALAAELERVTARNETAVRILNESAAWDSSRPYTQEEAREYHTAIVMALSFLAGNHDAAALAGAARAAQDEGA